MISTFDELKAKITDWLKREDLSANAADFICLAEAYFNRTIRATEMETRSQATVDSEYIGLPDDFVALREIHLENARDKPLKYFAPQELTYRVAEGDTGTPYAYTIEDGQIKLYPAPAADSTVNIEIIYMQKIPALSDSNTSNWLLTSHPDIYLHGALVEAEGYIYNDPRMATWMSKRDTAIAQLNDNANKTRLGAGPMIPRARNIV